MDFNAFADAFTRLQGRYAFGVPGGGPSLQLVDALSRKGTQFITTGHETTAALMAAAATRQTGNPALAITIKGPGFANLAPGLLSNAYEGYAHLSMAEAYPPGKGGARKHKWLDHARLGGEFLKAHRQFSSAPDFLAQSWAEAQQEFPGPVQIDLAAGDNSAVALPAASSDGLGNILSTVRQAEHPVLIVGSLALRSSWRITLAKLQIPIFTTVAAKGVLPEISSYAAGVYTGDGKSITPEKVILPQADLVITIGVRSGEILNPAAPGAKCIVLDSVSIKGRTVFPENRFGETCVYLHDAEIAELLAALESRVWGETEIAKAFTALDQQLSRYAWSPVMAYRQLQTLLPAATHVLDTGNFTVVGEHCLRVADERQILGTPNGRYLGMGVGYALGASAVAQANPVVLWIGDGGLRAFFSELSLAVENRLKLLVLVMKDGYYGSVRGRALSQGWTCDPLLMKDRHFAGVAARMGLFTAQTTSVTALAEAVQLWRDGEGPGLIECAFNADE